MRGRGHRAGLLLAYALGFGSAAEAGETIAYSYDSLGRLIRVEHEGSVNDGASAQYSYDPADNRTRVRVGGIPTVGGGGFKSPEAGNHYLYGATGSPAVFLGHSGVAGNQSSWILAAPEGDQAAFLQSYGVASTITLPIEGLTPGASYKVRFWIAARPGFGANPVTLSYEGKALGTFTPAATAFASVVSAAFIASAPSGSLTFTGSAAAADLGTALDRVTLEAGPRVAGGSFEAPEVGTGYAYLPAGSPAAFTGHSGIAGNRSAWILAASDGDQAGFLQAYGIASTIKLAVRGLTPGANYKIRFWIATRPGFAANPVTPAYEGVPLGNFTPGSAAFAAVDSQVFTASAETGVLSFTGSASAADLGTGLDRVTIVVAGAE